MSTAVAALSLPAKPLPAQTADYPSPADGSDAPLAGADFAALLLGQLTLETGLKTQASDASTAETLLTETAASPQDAALLLASMGIAMPPALPTAQLTQKGEAATLSTDADLSIAIAADPALATATDKAMVLGQAVATENSRQPPLTSESAQPSGLGAQAQAGTPAKLAGFEQKLADALPGVTELPTTPQQAASAVQIGNTQTTPLRQATEQVRLDTPMKDQAWPAEFGQKVVWLATQDKQSAQITLNPPQLGPIEISLNVKNDQATAIFASASAEVREAIESALPRLREMLAGVGVELGQTNVSAESFRQAYEENNNGNANGRGDAGTKDGSGLGDNNRLMRGDSMLGTNIKRGNGLVDTFA